MNTIDDCIKVRIPDNLMDEIRAYHARKTTLVEAVALARKAFADEASRIQSMALQFDWEMSEHLRRAGLLPDGVELLIDTRYADQEVAFLLLPPGSEARDRTSAVPNPMRSKMN